MSPTAHPRARSTAPTNTMTMITVTITTMVESRSSLRVGQLTFDDSTRTSFTNSRTCSIHAMTLRSLVFSSAGCRPFGRRILAGLEGFEPPTPGFGDRCSSQTELQACLVADRGSFAALAAVAACSKYLTIRLRRRSLAALRLTHARRRGNQPVRACVLALGGSLWSPPSLRAVASLGAAASRNPRSNHYD